MEKTTDTIDVFISRKSADAAYAKVIYHFLTQNGLNVFESDHSLQTMGNADYGKAIDDTLVKATNMIVVASSGENINSSWVEAEWRFFLNRKRSGKVNGNIITVIAGKMRMDEVPPSLANYEVINYDKTNLDRLLGYMGKTVMPKPYIPIPVKKPFDTEKLLNNAKKIIPNSLIGMLSVGIVLIGIVFIFFYLKSQPFDLTISAKQKPDINLKPSYPAFRGGDLSVFIDNKEERNQLLPNGEIVLKHIPGKFVGEDVVINLRSKYWKPEHDTVTLSKNLTLLLVPDGSLGTIRGNIRNPSGSPLADVSITVDNETAFVADNQGNFAINLPYNLQKEVYSLSFQKQGFQSYKKDYSPKSGNIDVTMRYPSSSGGGKRDDVGNTILKYGSIIQTLHGIRR